HAITRHAISLRDFLTRPKKIKVQQTICHWRPFRPLYWMEDACYKIAEDCQCLFAYRQQPKPAFMLGPCDHVLRHSATPTTPDEVTDACTHCLLKLLREWHDTRGKPQLS